MSFQIKRVYESTAAADGTRVLVDRLWPRGIRKLDATWTRWMKDVAPSTDLRRWFGHRPGRFATFTQRYQDELRGNDSLEELRRLGRNHVVTLLYAARDPRINHASVLLSILRAKAR